MQSGVLSVFSSRWCAWFHHNFRLGNIRFERQTPLGHPCIGRIGFLAGAAGRATKAEQRTVGTARKTPYGADGAAERAVGSARELAQEANGVAEGADSSTGGAV